MAGKYIGTLLIERGVLTATQVEQILDRQKRTGQPFGETAVMLYGTRMADIWRAIANQKMENIPRVNLATEPHEECALKVIPARQAWITRVLPLRFEGETLVCATTPRSLPDAMALLHERLDHPIDFVLAEELPLKQAIMERYPAS